VLQTRWLILSMVAAVMVISGLAYWDEQQRSRAGLDDFGEQQASVASALGLAVATELAAMPSADPTSPRVTATLSAFERDGVRVLFVAPDGRTRTLRGDDGQLPGLHDDTHTLRLDREQAASLGLPARTAMVGVTRLPGGWRLAVAATAERQRDRDREGLGRLLLAIGLAAGLVTIFGGLALRRLRIQLDLERELAVASVARAKDAELERMSRAATMAALGSGVAHELSTPLGVIVGRAEQLLARGGADERLAKAAQAIIDQAEQVDRVVRGLLGLARGAPIALQEVEPRELVREAAALVEHRFARAHVELLPAVASGLPKVRCEPLLFKHALVNLLLNACDASPPGSTVRVEVVAEAGELVFAVSDDGEGITPAAAARAVEPFFTTKPAGQGTGLGLAIAHEIASTHRGTLAIAPKSPRGTRASITVPVGGAHA
jgi:signal transduction histidine kinase